MALGPEALDKNLRQKAETLEQKIDEAIINHKSQHPVTVDVANEHEWVVKEIIRRYKLAGWASVALQSDQRNGSYLQLVK